VLPHWEKMRDAGLSLVFSLTELAFLLTLSPPLKTFFLRTVIYFTSKQRRREANSSSPLPPPFHHHPLHLTWHWWFPVFKSLISILLNAVPRAFEGIYFIQLDIIFSALHHSNIHSQFPCVSHDHVSSWAAFLVTHVSTHKNYCSIVLSSRSTHSASNIIFLQILVKSNFWIKIFGNSFEKHSLTDRLIYDKIEGNSLCSFFSVPHLLIQFWTF
jgi:hypothetical protein